MADRHLQDYPDVPPIPWWVSLCTEKYKYIRWLVPGEIEEMYDLEADPDEQKNLVNDPEHTALHRELKDRLMEQIIRQDYPVPPRDLFLFGIH